MGEAKLTFPRLAPHDLYTPPTVSISCGSGLTEMGIGCLSLLSPSWGIR